MLARATRTTLPYTQRTLFRFQGCLHAQASLDAPSTRRASTSTIPPTVDDVSLIPLFDQPHAASRTPSLAYTGLFLHRSLTTPAGFTTLAEGTLQRAQLLTNRILRARQSRHELLMVVKNLDKLSDLLCGVIDLAELIRNAHPDAAWVQSANDAYEKLCEFMNVLNTHVGLYHVRELYGAFCGPTCSKKSHLPGVRSSLLRFVYHRVVKP